MATQEEGGERVDQSVEIFEEGEVIARVDESADPFAAELAEDRDVFFGEPIFVILDGEFDSLFAEDRLGARDGFDACGFEIIEFGEGFKRFVTAAGEAGGAGDGGAGGFYGGDVIFEGGNFRVGF